MYQKATIAFGVNVPSKNINIFNQSWIGIKMVILDFPTISHMFDVESITDIVIFNKYYRFVVRFNFRGEICVYLKNIYFATATVGHMQKRAILCNIHMTLDTLACNELHT